MRRISRSARTFFVVVFNEEIVPRTLLLNVFLTINNQSHPKKVDAEILKFRLMKNSSLIMATTGLGQFNFTTLNIMENKIA